jgi:hypothetical protein
MLVEVVGSAMEEEESAMEEGESAMEEGESAMEGVQAHHSIPSGSTNLWYNTKSLRALRLGYDNNCDLQDLYLDSLLPF